MKTTIYTTPNKWISNTLISQKIKHKEYKLMLKNTNEKQINENLKRNLLDEFR